MSVNFNSNREEVEKQVDDAILKSLRLVGGLAERKAKETISDMKAVDTGFLRNSITFALGGESANISDYSDDNGDQKGSYSGTAPTDEKNEHAVWIGSNVYYAPYVELGTTKMNPRPFLGDSIQANQAEFEKLFKEAFSHFK